MKKIGNNMKLPVREQFSNKGTFGKILNFAGCKNYIGAAYLSSVSALKIGGGFVALATEKEVINSVSKLLPEAVYLSRQDGIKTLNNHTVCLIGCGLGSENKSVKLFTDVLKKIDDMPVIIDADGLNILSKIRIKTPQNLIITPHPNEAARLLGVNIKYILENLEESAKELSEKYNCVTVLKTHRTIICDKNRIFINQHGNSALAKAGTGDVLAGIISGLVAQGMDLFEGAKLGVYVHSRAGEIASEQLSEYSVLASDLPNYIHYAIKEIL